MLRMLRMQAAGLAGARRSQGQGVPDQAPHQKKRSGSCALSPFVDAERFQLFKVSAKVYCTCCKQEMGAVAGNIRNSHSSSKAHIARWEALLKKTAGKAAAAAQAAAFVDSLRTPEASRAYQKKRETDTRSLRALLSAAYTATAAPATMKDVLAIKSPIMAAATFLHGVGMDLGADATMARDRKVALTALNERIKTLVNDEPVCIVLDGAGTALLGGAKPVAVLASGAGLRHPVVLGTPLTPPDDGSAETFAPVLKKLLEDFGINVSTCVSGIMGDNVAWNSALADFMGLPHFKCLPHSLQLAFKALAQGFPLFQTLTLGMNAVLHAGGTTKRSHELENEYGVKASATYGYSNR